MNDRCYHCGRKAIKWVKDPNGDTVPLCKAHREFKACSMCGSYKHTPGHAHPDFWASKKDCAEVTERLVEYFLDRLSIEKKRAIERHLDSCSKCKQVSIATKYTLAALVKED